ncbi:hypothetical protein D7X74_04590 [Corallococcus sp. CA047B]|uniref:hypothetical protein n=1 Tax=Corallococcus sp. CA047B TaxID=2316729 RepID=UPI000EA0A0F2|nr:hypothetical protein [Corallococcus sp. CA047B]RKH20222.1 hypothetical protein D7X74_04590 [Corallococcus sp. CA047B]
MSSYDSLFRNYLEELRTARDEAMRWWDSLVQFAGEDPESAYAQVRLRWPAGPVSYPRIIAVYRNYYLACVALNEELESTRQSSSRPSAGWGEDDEDDAPGIIPPVRLLLDGLEPADPELSRFMEGFVFSPIGLDVNGRTV